MTFNEQEVELYSDYMNYIKLLTKQETLIWCPDLKWAVLIGDKPKEVVSYHQWLKMVKREELLNNLFKDFIKF